MATPWNPKNQPGPKVVTSGSVSRPSTPPWRPQNEKGPKVVKDPEPRVTG